MNILAEGGTVTLLGILIVFVCLILIIFLIMLMSWIMKPRKKETEAEEKFEEKIHEPLPEIPVVEVENNELVAVLTAAVAAFMEDSSSRLVVRSYRRVSPDSAWARAGRNAQINSKF